MKEIVKLVGTNAFANVVSALAFFIAVLTFYQTQHQLNIQDQDILIFTRDSAYSEIVYLLYEDGSYAMNIPVRVIVTNRSERNHPLQDLYFKVGSNVQFVKEIFDKDKSAVALPINIPSNESRVLFFYLKVPLTKKQGEYLANNLSIADFSSQKKWHISTLFDLTKAFLILKDKMMGADLIGVHSQGTLVYHFATTRDGNPYQVEEEYYIP